MTVERTFFIPCEKRHFSRLRVRLSVRVLNTSKSMSFTSTRNALAKHDFMYEHTSYERNASDQIEQSTMKGKRYLSIPSELLQKLAYILLFGNNIVVMKSVESAHMLMCITSHM